MFATAIWFMFCVWISIEHGNDNPTSFQTFLLFVALVLCLAADVRDILGR